MTARDLDKLIAELEEDLIACHESLAMFKRELAVVQAPNTPLTVLLPLSGMLSTLRDDIKDVSNEVKKARAEIREGL